MTKERPNSLAILVKVRKPCLIKKALRRSNGPDRLSGEANTGEKTLPD